MILKKMAFRLEIVIKKKVKIRNSWRKELVKTAIKAILLLVGTILSHCRSKITLRRINVF
jgi:hypothetical protein